MIYSATGGLILVTVLLAIWALPHWQAAKEARRRLLSSSLPVVILAPKTGAILDANTRAIREFSLSLNNGRLGFPEIADIAALKSVLQGGDKQRGFVCLQSHLGQRQYSITCCTMVSGLSVAYGLVLSRVNLSTGEDTSGTGLQSAINALSELVCYQGKGGDVIATNHAFDRFWNGRELEGVIFDTPSPKGKRRSCQTWTTAPDGSSRLLETNQSLLKNSNDEIIGSLSISHDVTEWHQMQEELRKEITRREDAEQLLATRSNLLEVIFEASSDPIGIYDSNFVYLLCNEPFAASLGQSRDAIIGRSAFDVIEEDLLASYIDRDRTILETLEPQTYEDLVFRPDGTQVWYEVKKTPLIDPTEGDPRLLVVARDVTQRKHTEQQLADAIMELQELSFVDSLTKIANRRRFDEQLRSQWQSHIRETKPISLILCDIDDFKLYNDNYGHQQGDLALQGVAEAFRNSVLRSTDLIARYGGEEFALLLSNTDRKGAEHVAEAVARELTKMGIVHEHSRVEPYLTISQGVVTLIPEVGHDYGELVRLADEALYMAKKGGRNCARFIDKTVETVEQ